MEYSDGSSGKNSGSSTKSRDSGGKSSKDSVGRSSGGSGGRSSSKDDGYSNSGSSRGGGGRSEELVTEIYCVWNGEVKGLRADEVMMHYQCGQLTERECITGGPLGQCQWVGTRHKLEAQLSVEGDANVLDIQISTMDIVLAIAFLITAAFAVEQLYRWWVGDHDEKLQGLTDDAQPLLV